MYDWRIERDDNGHAWYSAVGRLDYYRELAMTGGYIITIRPSTDEERAQIYRGM